MNFRKAYLTVIVAIVVVTSFNTTAQPPDIPYLGMGTGVAGVLDSRKIFFGSLEYRFGTDWYSLHPWVGMDFGYNAIYAAGGIRKYFGLTENIFIIPGFGIGLYSEKDSVKLGSPVEFKSTLEITYRFNNQSMIGMGFSHISNGGLDEKNPGSEMVTVCYYFPL